MQPLANLRRSEHGAVVVMVAVWLPVLALFASFAIDIGHFFDYSRSLQNRADAAAYAAADQFGNICASNPTDPRSNPERAIGEMAQLFSGPPGPASDVPYTYNGTGSPLDTNLATGPLAQFWAQAGTQPVQYQNLPNLTVKNGTNGANYHVLLNADNYAASGGTNFAMGDFCNGNPTLDKTDTECFGQTNLQGPLATDCATGAMVDVKLTQSNVPLFFPLLNASPNISAHARAAIQGVGQENNIRPLGVRDPGSTPCLKVNFVPVGGTGTPPPMQTIRLTLNTGLTGNSGADIWDNSGDNAGAGDPVNIPSGWNLYMQAVLYAQGVDGTCNTVSNALNYEQSSGILYVNSFPSTSLGSLASGAAPKIDTGGVTLGGTCNPDPYFSSSANCTVSVTSNVAFASDAGTKSVWAVDTSTGNALSLTQGAGNAWSGSSLTVNALSGQHPLCIQTEQTGGSVPSGSLSTCPGYSITGGKSTGGACTSTKPCYVSLGIQQQTYAACDGSQNPCTDPNDSGAITSAELFEGLSPPTTAFASGTHTLLIRVDVAGLQDASLSDRCPSKCTVLRYDQGNSNGMVDCGQGNGASAAAQIVLQGCPIFGDPACTDQLYCGSWTKSANGLCNNVASRPIGAVNCVNTNNDGAQIPSCVAALIQTGGTVNTNNCNVTGATGCSEDRWLEGVPIPPGDPRVITTFVVYSGDLSGATGNTDLPIRTFASFYVTGWTYNGNPITCPTNPINGVNYSNEPPPSNLPTNGQTKAVWGHWITYTEPGAGGSGQPCNFLAFGDCAAVLTR